MFIKYAENYRSLHSFNKATISVFRYFILIKKHTSALFVIVLLIYNVKFLYIYTFVREMCLLIKPHGFNRLKKFADLQKLTSESRT